MNNIRSDMAFQLAEEQYLNGYCSLSGFQIGTWPAAGSRRDASTVVQIH